MIPAILSQAHIGYLEQRLHDFKDLLSKSCKNGVATSLPGIDILLRKTVPEDSNTFCSGYRVNGLEYTFYLDYEPYVPLSDIAFVLINPQLPSYCQRIQKIISEIDCTIDILHCITQETRFEQFEFYMGYPHQEFDAYFQLQFTIENIRYSLGYYVSDIAKIKEVPYEQA